MSPQYLSPGVYVEEVDRGSKPIEGVGTAVAGFVGFAAKAPVNTATFIANWTQYANVFGGFVAGAYLAHGVYGYFNNGGGSCYVVRLPSGEPGEEGPPKAAASLTNVTLRYQVNSEDNSVTLLVVDVATRKVLRTVPPEELARLGFDHIIESLA